MYFTSPNSQECSAHFNFDHYKVNFQSHTDNTMSMQILGYGEIKYRFQVPGEALKWEDHLMKHTTRSLG